MGDLAVDIGWYGYGRRHRLFDVRVPGSSPASYPGSNHTAQEICSNAPEESGQARGDDEAVSAAYSLPCNIIEVKEPIPIEDGDETRDELMPGCYAVIGQFDNRLVLAMVGEDEERGACRWSG